jgi:uncharacterized caspase-like protein
MNRIALVIGNSNYLSVNQLNNPQNDANDIESVLTNLEFDVSIVQYSRGNPNHFFTKGQ